MIDLAQFGAARLLQTHDWTATPLGSRNQWPQSLTTLVDTMLASGHAMCLVWGPAQTLLYNDAYAPLMGNRRPSEFGSSFAEAWPEIWDEIEPLVDKTFAGTTFAVRSRHAVTN